MELETAGASSGAVSNSSFCRMRLMRFGGKGSCTITPFVGRMVSGPPTATAGFDFREHDFEVECKRTVSSLGMPSELEIMAAGLQASHGPGIPARIASDAEEWCPPSGEVARDARVYYSVLDKSHGDTAIWFLYTKGYIMGVQVFFPKITRLWKFIAMRRAGAARVPRFNPTFAGYMQPDAYAYGAGGGQAYGGGGVYGHTVRLRNDRPAVRAGGEPGGGRVCAQVGKDVEIYGRSVQQRDAGKVPRSILVQGIPGESHGVTLEYKEGARYANQTYRVEPYADKGRWYWALYKGSTRLGRKATEQTSLISSARESKWSFQAARVDFEHGGRGITFTEAVLQVQGVGEAVPLRAAGAYLPLQPRRLAARSCLPRADGPGLAAMMADLTEITRALNEARLGGAA
jgi:hypothetical protein